MYDNNSKFEIIDDRKIMPIKVMLGDEEVGEIVYRDDEWEYEPNIRTMSDGVSFVRHGHTVVMLEEILRKLRELNGDDHGV